MSKMLGGTQVTLWVIHFVSEMLGGTQVTFWVIHFVSEMLGGTEGTVWVIPFVSEMIGDTQLTYKLYLGFPDEATWPDMERGWVHVNKCPWSFKYSDFCNKFGI